MIPIFLYLEKNINMHTNRGIGRKTSNSAQENGKIGANRGGGGRGGGRGGCSDTTGSGGWGDDGGGRLRSVSLGRPRVSIPILDG